MDFNILVSDGRFTFYTKPLENAWHSIFPCHQRIMGNHAAFHIKSKPTVHSNGQPSSFQSVLKSWIHSDNLTLLYNEILPQLVMLRVEMAWGKGNDSAAYQLPVWLGSWSPTAYHVWTQYHINNTMHDFLQMMHHWLWLVQKKIDYIRIQPMAAGGSRGPRSLRFNRVEVSRGQV